METIVRLTEIFRRVLQQPDLELRPETTANDVDGWDSMGHVELIVEVEKVFGTKFSMGEILAMKNVGDLAKALDSRRATGPGA